MQWGGGYTSVGEAIRGERIGLEAVSEGVWHVHLGECGSEPCTSGLGP